MLVLRKHRMQTWRAGRVKSLSTYDVQEIAKLCNVHRGTVRNWLKNGLQAIDGHRPTIVHGSELKRFLVEKRGRRRQKCSIGQFYCFRCRKPRRPWGDTADGKIHTDKIARLTALCPNCGTPMHRMVRRADLPKFAALMEIRALGPERIADCATPSENIDSCQGCAHAQIESPK